MEKVLQRLLNEGHSIKIYENALGTITIEAQSTASEIILQKEEDEYGILKETPWGDRVKTVKLVGEVITDGKTIIEALQRLEEKLRLNAG